MYPTPWKFPSRSFILQMKENEDTRFISLKVNPEQREMIIQFINFNAWDLEEMLFKEGSVCQDANCRDQDFERTFCIPQMKIGWVPT